MDEKTEAIESQLLEGMAGLKIQYQHSGGLHKFRIEGEAQTHWLYLSDEVVDDSEPDVLINLVNTYNIVDTLNQANESKWLFLSSDGVREVDEHFAKG